MAILKKEIKEIPAHIYGGSHFGLFTSADNIKWLNCRDTFLKNVTENKHFGTDWSFFFSKNETIEDVFKRLHQYESQLNIPEDRQMCLSKTNRNLIYQLEPKWWNDPIRLSLLTVFIRDDDVTQKNYVGGSSNSYFGQTKHAIDHFLKGNIFYNNDKYHGWVTDFSPQNSLSKLQKEPVHNTKVEIRWHVTWHYTKVELKQEV